MNGPDAATDAIARSVLDAAFVVHSALGPGLLESIYEMCLLHELQSRGIRATRQLALPVIYRDLHLEGGFRLDLLVEDTVVVEVKAAENHNPLFEAQLPTYLRLSRRRLGLLINFNVPRLKEGIRRMVL